jgi:hypothetical protein
VRLFSDAKAGKYLSKQIVGGKSARDFAQGIVSTLELLSDQLYASSTCQAFGGGLKRLACTRQCLEVPATGTQHRVFASHDPKDAA